MYNYIAYVEFFFTFNFDYFLFPRQILPEHKEHNGTVPVEQYAFHAIPGARQVCIASQQNGKGTPQCYYR